ncbi:MAG TPA: cytochrome c [Candidatus Eisenbacteria bacterium]
MAKRAAAAAAIVAAMAAIGCAKPPATTKAEMTPEEKIARGRQISYTSACHDCHTPGGLYGAPDTTRMLSGSELGWEGPWGVSFPRNLTPDMETGIGSWSEQDIVTAIRTGIRPDKSPLMPPMPWPMYSHLSDEDAFALAAFLKSIPAVSHKAPDHIMPGAAVTASRVTFPPPPAWDAQNLPKPQ